MGPWLSVCSIPASFNNSFPLCLRSLAQCFHAFFFASQSYYLHLWVSEEPKIFSHHLQYMISSKHSENLEKSHFLLPSWPHLSWKRHFLMSVRIRIYKSHLSKNGLQRVPCDIDVLSGSKWLDIIRERYAWQIIAQQAMYKSCVALKISAPN